MASSYDPEHTRKQLLEAAAEIIRLHGVSRLTLERVAEEAGVSKGGLLHHFPTKNALMKALMHFLLARYDERLNEELAREPPDGRPGRWLRAYLRVTFSESSRDHELSAALMLAIAREPELSTAALEYFHQVQEAAENDGMEPTRSTLIRLAADGLWFCEVFGLSPPTGDRRLKLMQTLLQLTESEDSDSSG